MSISFVLSLDTIISTSFFCHVSGSMAETVIKPRGGTAAFLEMKCKACLKPQKESGYCGNTNRTFIYYLYFNCRKVAFLQYNSYSKRINYFFEDTRINMPPTPITAIPISGDQLRWCGLFAEILRLPMSTTFSLVKKVTAVKMVKINPRITIRIPAFFIKYFYLNIAER